MGGLCKGSHKIHKILWGGCVLNNFNKNNKKARFRTSENLDF